MLVVLRIAGELVFVLVAVLAVFISLLTLPGSLLILAASVVHSALTGWQRPGWQALIVLAAMAALAEASDTIAAMWGARRYGASMRTSLVAGIGAFLGAAAAGTLAQVLGILAVAGGPVLWLVANAVIVIAGASAGAFVAAYWWELRRGASPDEARRAGLGGAVGRVMALVARVAITVAMAAVAVVSAL